MASGTDGTFYSSYPLAEDGNYAFYTHSDAYKATVTKEDMSEVEEDLYESYNLGLVRPRSAAASRRRWFPDPSPLVASRSARVLQLASDNRASIAPGHGIRINGVKYNWMRELTSADAPEAAGVAASGLR